MASIEDLKSKMISKGGMAVSNQFAVVLPGQVGGKEGEKLDTRDANILCKNVNLPGRQITTLNRSIGLYNHKVVNGFIVDDVTMTFRLMNDYGVRKYFDDWMNLMVGHSTRTEEQKKVMKGTVGWHDDYTADITIHQLRKPQVRVGFDLGPLDINFDILGESIYTVKLLDAFPTSMSTIQLSDDQDGMVDATVTFSYVNWVKVKDERFGITPDINFNFGGLI
jgi:hypothetical protein